MQFFVLSLYLQKYFRTINYRVEYFFFDKMVSSQIWENHAGIKENVIKFS